MFFYIVMSLIFFVIVREETSAITSFSSQERLIGPWIYSRLRRDSNLNMDSRKNLYDIAVNETIADYYAQRKAVMDRYYARQREISEKFSKKASSGNSVKNILVDEDKDIVKIPSTARQDESPRITRHQSGYERQGECKHGPNEHLVYQHNLGIGLNGPSQLDATLKVNLDGPISITCVEALPYNNSSGILSWISGGPGTDFVQLNLKALENKGVSYTIKIWGIKITKFSENN